MGGACRTRGRNEKYIQKCGRKAWNEETTLTTWYRREDNIKVDLGKI
jgi:hypothetical protein